MATVNGLTAERMLDIEAHSVIDGTIDETGHLIFTQHDGTQIDAGAVPALPDASDLVKGVVELATDAETAALSDDTKVVTPKSLAAVNNIPLPLSPGSFSQTTDFTSYPQGLSRIYYTAVNSTAWDFSGKAGEVLTYRDGTDFAKQEWTKHIGGSSSGAVARWVRTANASGGWTPWRILARDEKLQDPKLQVYANAVTVTATSFSNVSQVSQISLTTAYDVIVCIELSAWLSVTYDGTVTLRAGVSVDGASPDTSVNGTWGQVLYENTQGNQSGTGQHSSSQTVKMTAGTHTFQVQAYKSGTGGTTLSYIILRVTPVRWAE